MSSTNDGMIRSSLYLILLCIIGKREKYVPTLFVSVIKVCIELQIRFL